MTRAKLLVLGLGIALLALFTAPAASAQDGPSITIEPASVEAAGEATFTITGAGWTVASAFVLPCFTVTTPEDLASAGASACDTANLTPVTIADGGFTAEVTYEVPEGGMCVATGDAAQTESAGACITVGAGDGGGEEEPAADDAAAEGEGEGEEELAETGVESSQLAILGAAILAAGVMVIGFSRRFTRA